MLSDVRIGVWKGRGRNPAAAVAGSERESASWNLETWDPAARSRTPQVLEMMVVKMEAGVVARVGRRRSRHRCY